MTTSLMLEHVAAFASQVRTCLRDLSPEQVEELTGGLEADLAEAIADADGRPVTGEVPVTAPGPGTKDAEGVYGPAVDTTVIDLAARFGTPETYAAELRSAAGLPPALAKPEDQRGLKGAIARGSARLQGTLSGAESTKPGPKWAALLEQAYAIGPLWTSALILLFGTLALSIFAEVDWLIAAVIGGGLIVLCCVLTFWSQDGTWSPEGGVRSTGQYLNVLAVIVFLPILGTASERAPNDVYYDDAIGYVSYNGDGDLGLPIGTSSALYVGGERATNLFVYGPDGKFIDGARIVDQDGRPVQLSPTGSLWDPDAELSMFWEPRVDAAGTDVWNAYPLGFWTSRMANWDGDEDKWVLPDGVNVRPLSPPIPSLNELGITPADSPIEAEIPVDRAPSINEVEPDGDLSASPGS